MKKGDKVKTWISTQIGTVKKVLGNGRVVVVFKGCLLYTSPSPRDGLLSRMPSSA